MSEPRGEIHDLDQPLPAAIRPDPSQRLAVDARDRVLKVSNAAANEQRRLAAMVRESAAKVCAQLDNEKKMISLEAEQKAAELEAAAEHMETSGDTVAQYIESYVQLVAAVGVHTEDLHDRLKAPVPHPNGVQHQ